MYKDTKHRFWSKVVIGEVEDCWLWMGGKGSGGYGIMNNTSKKEGHATLVSRYVLELYIPKIGKSLEVGHKCSNRNCVNPYHLYLTSREENNREHMHRSEYYYPVLFEKAQVRAIREDGILCQNELPVKQITVEMPEVMFCGHSKRYVVSSFEGTQYCVMCAYQSEHVVYKKVKRLHEELFTDV